MTAEQPCIAETRSPWKLPSWRWFRSPWVQGIAIFMALVGYGHDSWRWAWTLGGYAFGLFGMTVAYWRERWEWQYRSPACPTCGGSGLAPRIDGLPAEGPDA